MSTLELSSGKMPKGRDMCNGKNWVLGLALILAVDLWTSHPLGALGLSLKNYWTGLEQRLRKPNISSGSRLLSI